MKSLSNDCHLLYLFLVCCASDQALLNIDGVESNWDETTATFDEMDLKEDLLRLINSFNVACRQVSNNL